MPFPAYSLTPPCLFLTKIFKLSRTDLVLLSLSSLRRKPALISTLIGRRRRAANCVLTRTGGQQDDAGRQDLGRIRVLCGRLLAHFAHLPRKPTATPFLASPRPAPAAAMCAPPSQAKTPTYTACLVRLFSLGASDS